MSSEEPSTTTPPPASESSSTTPTPTPPTTTTWQAIFAPQYNTYYFYNSLTQETTWVNPLQPPPEQSEQPETQPEASTSTVPLASTSTEETELVDPNTQSASTVSSRYASLQAAAVAQGIDPLLAHLDPSLLAPSVPGSSGGGGGINDPPSFTAKFNSRTGQYTPASSRTPGHLSEHERAKRMSEFYFDVGKWEEDLAKRGGRLMGEEDGGGEEGTREKKRKRPTKKDLDRFKEQKRLKKIAKTAWLRT